MPSLVAHGSIRTAAAERVVAPTAAHLCHLVLLCESAEDPEQFAQLEGVAQAVAKATQNMAAVASRRMAEMEDDEVMRMEMSPLLEPMAVSGQHVLLAAQKLSIQPGLAEHREELITATQNVLLGMVKVLLAEDDAAVRKILAAAEWVLECLSALATSMDISSLLRSFQVFSEALLLLNGLTVERADSLQDPRQTKSLLGSLETLRKCISMLHTALCTTIKHPASDQAQAAKRYILDQVESTVNDVTDTLKSQCARGLGPHGFYTERRESLLQLLASYFTSSIRGSGFDSMVRDLVLHCMVVANLSRKELQQRVVGHCRHVLQLWSDMTRILKFPVGLNDNKQQLENISTSLMQQIQTLDTVLMTSVLYQVMDMFLTASSSFDTLASVTAQLHDVESSSEFDLDSVQTLIEDLLSHTDTIIQVANFISGFAMDAKSLENVENSSVCLTRLRAGMASFSLELDDTSLQTIGELRELCQRWEEETGQLQDAISDVMDVREFTNIAIHEMVHDRRGCDVAYREQSYRLFKGHGDDLLCHMKQVIRSVRRHLDRSDNPIYRNGLLVLLKQVESSQAQVVRSVRDMLSGSRLNVEVFSTFSEDVSLVVQHFKVLREGLDGQQHPHLLSPLREEARRPVVSPPPSMVRETEEVDLGVDIRGIVLPVLEVEEGDLQVEHEEECSERETVDVPLARKYDFDDLMTPSVSDEPKPTHKPLDFDLLPLLYEVVTVTKGKDVTVLNQACTGVLELSNCYVQAAKEASAIVDAVDCQTLDMFRAELVSLTPLLVQTAQETAMSSGMSTDSIFKHCALFSDLINNTRKVLLPQAGTWYHAIYAMLQGNQPHTAATVAQQLGEVMSLCADVVQLLTSSDVLTQSDCQESFTALHSKLNKAQNNTRHLAELSNSLHGQVDKLEGPCILWALSIQILLNSLDKILGMSTALRQITPQKKLAALSENSLRIQEAARLTSLNCKSLYKVKQLTDFQAELKTLTDAYLQVAEDLGIMPSVLQLAKCEFFQRHLLIKTRLVSGHLSKANKDYVTEIQNLISVAYRAAETHGEDREAEDAEQQFEDAAQVLFENIKAATKRMDDCFNYIRDPRARVNLRSINDHLSFQIPDIVGRARLMVETRSVCDTLSLEVQLQCWAAKAHYMSEEIYKVDGIQQEAKEQIRCGLQGRISRNLKEISTTVPSTRKEVDFASDTTLASWLEGRLENAASVEANTSPVPKYEPSMEKHDGAVSPVHREASSLANTSLFLKQEFDSWDPKDNRIVQVTRKMADQIYYMTQYLRKKGPIPNKEAFVSAAKDVISNCQSVTQFVRVIANHCLDKQCTVELSLIMEQILTVTNQLTIISSVNSVTPGCKSSDEILVKNAQNLLQTVLLGVRAAETACIKGLKQPEPHSDGAEAAALCFQWKRNLQIHRAQQNSSLETDDLGLRKTSSHPAAPSLAPPVHVQEGFK